LNQVIGAPRSNFAITRKRERLFWPSGRKFRILSIDGGGIKGIFPAALLAEVEQQFLGGESAGQFFDMIVGTSTGGIIALGLGARLTARQMLDLYMTKGQEIFPPGQTARWFRNLRSLAMYRYDRSALTAALTDVLGTRVLAESSRRLCIPAFEGHHGEVYVFKTPHHPDFHLDGMQTMVDVAQATSAAPTYFRSHDSGGYRFIDGGLWANNPVMLGVVDALTCFRLDPSDIQVLSIGCGRQASIVRGWQAWGGLFSWRSAIASAMDLQSQNATAQARLLAGPEEVVRLEPTVSPAMRLDDWGRASSELPAEAQRILKIKVETIGSLFFRDKTDSPTMYWPPGPGRSSTEQTTQSIRVKR
jgi:patatin-like phospholipase/acyl hydrolase